MLRQNQPQRKQLRQKEAQERQAVYQALTPAEKLAKLDNLFGVGQGAQKERKKLNNLKEKTREHV